jgi:hypothetical protein
VRLVAHSELVGNVLAKVAYSPFGGERVAVFCRDNAVYLFNGHTLNLRCVVRQSSAVKSLAKERSFTRVI